jgi:hypothetical protein
MGLSASCELHQPAVIVSWDGFQSAMGTWYSSHHKAYALSEVREGVFGMRKNSHWIWPGLNSQPSAQEASPRGLLYFCVLVDDCLKVISKFNFQILQFQEEPRA